MDMKKRNYWIVFEISALDLPCAFLKIFAKSSSSSRLFMTFAHAFKITTKVMKSSSHLTNVINLENRFGLFFTFRIIQNEFSMFRKGVKSPNFWSQFSCSKNIVMIKTVNWSQWLGKGNFPQTNETVTSPKPILNFHITRIQSLISHDFNQLLLEKRASNTLIQLAKCPAKHNE